MDYNDSFSDNWHKRKREENEPEYTKPKTLKDSYSSSSSHSSESTSR